MNKNELFPPRQIHKGSGDNVNGDKHVNNINNNNLYIADIVLPKNIQKSVLDILNDLRDHKTDGAKTKLTVLKSLDNLDEECSAIIEALSIHSNLIEKDNIENDLYVINTYLTKYENPLIRDLCLSALIELLYKQDKHYEALERFKYEKNPGEYAKKSYFTFLADSAELQTTFNSSKYNLTERELDGIVCGALRQNQGELAYNVAEYLNQDFNSYNSQFLLLYSKAVKLNPIISKVHYWLCTSEQRNELLDISTQLIQLFEQSENKDYCIFNIATPIINYLRGDHDGLLSLCRKYINEVKKVDEFVANCIDKNVVSRNISTSEIDLYKVDDDENYKQEALKHVLRKEQISTKEFFLLSQFASPQQIKNWLEKHGEFSTEKKIESDFNSFYLKTLSVINNKDLHYIYQVKCDFYSLINKYPDIKNEVDPEYILELSKNLFNIGLSFEASRLLNSLIISYDDFWNSPLINFYIKCLYQSQQYLHLYKLLDKVQKETWDSDIFIIKAKINSFNGNFIGSEKIINESLNFNKLNLASWEYLVNLHRTLKTNEIECILNNIPDELFNKPSKIGKRLLILMAKNNLFNKAEKIIISWFIQDPNKTAIHMTDFNLSLGVNDVEFASKINNCLGGITYQLADKIFTKLIVENPEPNQEIFLDISSPLLNFLNKLAIGEKTKYLMNEIEILARTSPYETAVKLAIELREKLNDGSDCFHSFTLPNDPNKINQFFKERLSFDKDPEKDEIFKNPRFPIIFKTHFMDKTQDPINAALIQFTNNKYAKHNLIDLGDESAKDIILDVYTICYLTLTQLSKNIEQAGLNIKITIETKSYLENWIAKFESGRYLKIGVDDNGKLIRTTSDDIKIYYSDMIHEIKHIIKIADIVYPKLIDVPSDLVFFYSSIDTATYSTILASISLDIHLLFIDQVFSEYLQDFGVKIYNPMRLFLKLGNYLDFQSKKLGLYLHASNCIPYALSPKDFFLLAESEDDCANKWLVKMINQYPRTINNNFEKYTKFLASTLSKFIVNGIRQHKFLQGSTNQDFRVNKPFCFGVDDVFFACCNNILKYPSKLASEEKLAIFLYDLTDYYKVYSYKINYDSRKLIQLIKWLDIATDYFISGHFMNSDKFIEHISNHNKLKNFSLGLLKLQETKNL